ncbi:WD40 repeat-like protein [Coemansia sp. RSA 1813]|nr:WD40 repeat-like protein [Coemansia sp. RSA 1843]KAJ2089955.1 WD40 repeat-like protein [Coemansia sp. RSA 986]KAJ2215271.1 WD40 repeat-like protein [Coemansia sp. RSA 487]KAJ2570975.1 WD40 repeat-like protein [Coemansia sp. RSA 1813]
MSFIKKEYFAPAPVTTRGQPVRLSADPKGEKFVYANGKTIVIRSLSEPKKAWEYTGHTAQTTVARFSPSGYYIASGDASGKVRIWDTVNEEHALKSEFQPISGRISDIAWDPESQRIMAVGEGRGQYGHVFTYDSGNTVGMVTGHSKVINACAMRQRRPFRAVTCSDDMTCVFYHGAPYKYAALLSDHAGFVQDVKYAPSDDYFVTVGSDKKIMLYDGKTGELVRQVAAGSPADAHTGSIFAVAWSPDSKYIVTSSGDRTCRFWDIEKDKLAWTVRVGGSATSPGHQQVGNLWAGEHIISLSLSGDINVLQMDAAEPVKVIYGHQKAITAAALTQSKRLYTGSYDGRLCAWDFATGASSSSPLGEASLVQGASGDARPEDAAASGELVAFGFLDDTLRFVEDSAVVSASSVGLGAAPRSLAIDDSGTAVVAVLANDDLVVCIKGKVTRVGVKETSAAPRAVAISNSNGAPLVAVGFQDNSVHMYELKKDTVELAPTGTKITAHSREITALSFSPTSELIATGDSAGKVVVSKAQTGELVTSRWSAHTARIYAVAWSPDGVHAASASLDGHVIVWSVEQPMRKIVIRNAHIGGAAAVFFTNNETVVSTGADSGVKVWDITYE